LGNKCRAGQGVGCGQRLAAGTQA
jgi:hypothetical protein